VSEAVAGLRALGFVGANVTIPHKTAVVPLLDEVHEEARLAGAVNTIVVRDERLEGYNTDVQGFSRALRDVYPGPLAGRAVLLLGAGGMARAVALVLAREGALVTVADRTPPAAERIVQVMAQVPGSEPGKIVALAALSAEMVRAADVIVNASALGMASVGKVPAALADNVRSDHVVCDVVYARQPTQLVAQARARDALTVDGLSMLVWQAAASFELWTSQTAPVEVMRSAVTGHRG
jgi:shikimate dehydrogenase